jgi:predicted alpha/beta hydrolase family esterase
LNIIENLNKPIKSAFFISGFLSSLGNRKFDELNSSFIDPILDWTIIKSNCKNFVIFHSNNDPYVPLIKAEHLAKKLGVNVKLVENGGHLNAEAGFTKFELLFDEIKKEL